MVTAASETYSVARNAKRLEDFKVAGMFAKIDTEWDRLKPHLASTFTTQTFRNLLEEKAPAVWAELVSRYGVGGKGSGQYYSPANILYNYLNDKSRKSEVIGLGFVPPLPGWSARGVKQWELVGVLAPPQTEEDKAFIEGGQTLRTHLVRERAPGLRDHVLKYRQAMGLSCEICGVTGETLEDDLREALFEIHHKTKPLGSATDKTTTRIEDIALLCACCHRLIHRLVSARKRWFSVDEAKQALRRSET